MSVMGFVNLYKPKGFTSHDCVAKVRKILATKKVGHGGTLDPLATGVLPIAVGKATRLLQFLPTKKAYQGKIRFGITTTTDDLEGEILQDKSARDLSLEKIESFLADFVGEIEQIPPAYSAIKQDGKKLYQLARQGKSINIPTRKVNIFNIEIVNWIPGDYPELDLNIVCGGGTYIRAIARDIGEKSSYGGTLANLIRTLSCDLKLENSITFEQLIQQKEKNQLTLIKPDLLLKHLAKIHLGEEESRKWCLGQKIVFDLENPQQFYCTYNHIGEFIGISETREDGETKLVKPKIVI